MNKERLFLALPIGEEQRAFLKQLMDTLQPQLRFQKWVHPDDLHITLKFLGDTDSAEKTRIQTGIKEIAASLSPFHLSLKGLGTFGKPTAPSILWVGVAADMGTLGNLQAQVESAAVSVGFTPEDRSYSPHISIARRYQGEGTFTKAELSPAENELNSAAMPWTADRIVLYRSHLSRKPMYEAIDNFPLQNAAALTGNPI